MTRNRANHDGVATPIMATYYQQRAGAGLIVSESAPVSMFGVGYPFTPGLYSEAQAIGWSHVTENLIGVFPSKMLCVETETG